jgi:hypothetical protein
MPLVEDIAKCGIHYTYEASPTVDFFSSQMYLYDLVFLVTHGGADEVNDVYVHDLVTADCLGVFDEGEVLTVDDWDQMFEKLDSIRRAHRNSSSDHITYGAVKEERDGVDKIVYYATVTEAFLNEKAVGHFNNPNSIFFNTACSSLKGNTNLAYEFLNRGLGVYIGYDDTNCKGKKAGPQFFRSMLGGQSFVKALTSLPYSYLVDDCGGNLQRVTDNRDAEFEKVFIFPTFTTELSDEQATESFNANQYLEFEGMTTASNFNAVTYGFVFDIDEDVKNGQFFESTEKTLYPSTTDRGNLKFNVEIRGFKRGQTYYYSAYTYDGELYNYGNTCSFTIGDEPQVPEDPEDEDRLLMLMANVNGALYSIYKQKMDKNDYHENPDGWKFYRSLLTLDVSRNGSTTTYTLDDNIYMEEGYNSNSAQNACMLFDLKSNQIYVFCVSKDQKSNYTMEGFCYGASLSDLNFQRETVFTSANWGWYPYFVESPSGRPAVAHFSYAGYYEIISTRDGSNNWSSEWGNKIQPDDFQTRSKQSGRVLVISGGTDPGNEPTSYTACPDGNHPHLIDLGLPSGTKWACCNLGASKPEDYGSYYAWGETVEKRVYTWNNYQYGYYNDDYDYSHMTNIGSDIAGTKYDVASVKTDGLWVMPNKAQFEELLNNTTHQYVANKGVKLVARNGGSIFLPSAGDHFDGSLGDSGYLGLYWSSTLFDEAPFAAYHYAFDCVSQIEHFTWLDRFDGVSVRPVWK